ncbi:hypothetical protein GIB67_024485 [Kingdonia uniflora]|uniref:NAD(P)-binding domain-containing protein n=1 Tax=Kingdonia uniflora TaxID=39325 RepID=A0A7J7LNY5_9MAGN|nr:hypothetical protein GIB67_024485 [Kingdonia uniflora]
MTVASSPTFLFSQFSPIFNIHRCVSLSSSLFSHSSLSPFSLTISPSLFISPLKSNKHPSSSIYSSFSVSASSAKKKVLIVNTNSGGHAIIGFYFAKELLSSGHEVTVMTVGEESSDKMKRLPFSRFSEIVGAGCRTVWGDPADVGKAVDRVAFDVVLDNNGKDIDTVRPVADWANSSGIKQFLYISSAGIYKPSDEPPHVEGDRHSSLSSFLQDVVEGEASHVTVERYIAEIFSSWAIFRPQYMIGSGNNKDCEEWFFDRK